MKIRFMTRGDIEEAVDIERLCFEEPWSTSDFLDEFRRHDSMGIVAIDPNCILGYLFYQRIDKEMHIVNVAVHPDDQRSGVGRAMVEWAQSKIAPRGIATAIVRESNIRALRFFNSVDFFATKIIRKPFRSSQEDGYLMTFEKNKTKLNLKNRISQEVHYEID